MLIPIIYGVAGAVGIIGFLFAFRGFDVVDDLLDDLRNPIDTCKTINSITPCYWAIQLCLTVLFIWQPILYVWNLAMLFFDGCQWARRGSDLAGPWWTQYDPKRIQRQASWIWYVQLVKCFYYAFSVIICVILAVINIFFSNSF